MVLHEFPFHPLAPPEGEIVANGRADIEAGGAVAVGAGIFVSENVFVVAGFKWTDVLPLGVADSSL